MVAVPLVGAVLPAQVPEVIAARSFVVFDEQGKMRATLSDFGLVLRDEAGGASRRPVRHQPGGALNLNPDPSGRAGRGARHPVRLRHPDPSGLLMTITCASTFPAATLGGGSDDGPGSN